MLLGLRHFNLVGSENDRHDRLGMGATEGQARQAHSTRGEPLKVSAGYPNIVI